MLRVIRRRLASAAMVPPGPRSIIPTISRCAHTAVEDISVPYGQEYGAGPSRLPYRAASDSSPMTGNQISIAGSGNGARISALRRHLASTQTTGQYANLVVFQHHLRGFNLPSPTEMSRGELHAVLHHLLRANQPILAFSIITSAIDAGHASSTRIRRLISTRTLRHLLRAESTHLQTLTTHSTPPTRPSVIKLQIMLDLLRSLQSIRHHRPLELYTLLVQTCIYHRRPDKAAEIFVGLVEEWVTEGRVAEGADAEGFYEGGGPPRHMSSSLSNKHRGWWIGVRTWTLPGEVLSPHDRLDLWHPTKLSLGKKFRNFPFPLATSPPSVVPPPSSRLLDLILAALRLDPAVATPEDFTASMRACAFLANTVLSRTLPLASLGPLLRALEATRSHPPVYPANLDPIPQDDAWAYEAFTQIHLALQSFFFSPPISASSFALARANETILSSPKSGSPPTFLAHKYRLQPLAFGDGIILVRYALEKMKMARLLERLLRYMKRSFTFWWNKPILWNTLLRGATVMGDKKLAEKADDALFGETALARSEVVRRDSRSASSEGLVPIDTSLTKATSEINALLASDPTAPAVQANEDSLVILVYHLGKTSQFDRLEDLVYSLIPYLQDSKDPSRPNPVTSADEDETNEIGFDGRRVPRHLTPALYTALLTSLSLGGKTGLSQRVFQLALSAEKSWTREYLEQYPGASESAVPTSIRLSLPIFSAMLRVWSNEVYAYSPVRGSNPGKIEYPVGWRPPRSLVGQPRHIAAGIMARTVYLQAAARFPPPPDLVKLHKYKSKSKQRGYEVKVDGAVTVPDAQFFDIALSALSFHLGFSTPDPTLSRTEMELLDKIIGDMQAFGIPVPPAVLARQKQNGAAMTVADKSISSSSDDLDVEEGPADTGRLTPKDYKVYSPMTIQKEREERTMRLRGLAEGLMSADEEGMWRDKEVREKEGKMEEEEWNVGRRGRREGEIVGGGEVPLIRANA